MSLGTWADCGAKVGLGETGSGNVLVEILKIALFLLFINHCKVSEQITRSFVEFETFNQGGLFWAILS